MVEWLNKTVSEQYKLVRVLRSSEKSGIQVLRHKTLDKNIVKRVFEGNGDVYRILQGVLHPNIPIIYEVVTEDLLTIVLEEYINGITLSDELQDKVYSDKATRVIIRDLCSALAALHSMGIIHRDVKPENVMINSDGIVKLIDFDTARMFKAYKSEDTSVIGTTGFAAPEQFGISQSDERTDIFSIGILMNVMLTGEHPSKSLYKGKLSGVIEKCTQIDPNKRYSGALSLAKEL
ncbi:MAG: serine/threonine protein kinase [Oscillospiraceae bacterium]|nr:serine/threonine protein kinase [Oscillospiraceae bacterium]